MTVVKQTLSNDESHYSDYGIIGDACEGDTHHRLLERYAAICCVQGQKSVKIEFILVVVVAFNIKTHNYIVVIYELEEVRFHNCSAGIAGSVLSDGTSKFGYKQLSNSSTEGCWAPMIILEICGSFRWSYLWLKFQARALHCYHYCVQHQDPQLHC